LTSQGEPDAGDRKESRKTMSRPKQITKQDAAEEYLSKATGAGETEESAFRFLYENGDSEIKAMLKAKFPKFVQALLKKKKRAA